MSKENFNHVFTNKLTVRWGDMDEFGHVNNARYLTYFEQTRIDWLISMGFKKENLGRPLGPIMITADVVFLKPIFFPAQMDIKLYVGEPGNSSFMTYHEIFVGDDLFATGHVKLVWFDYEKQKTIKFPDDIRALME